MEFCMSYIFPFFNIGSECEHSFILGGPVIKAGGLDSIIVELPSLTHLKSVQLSDSFFALQRDRREQEGHAHAHSPTLLALDWFRTSEEEKDFDVCRHTHGSNF